jgi:hypothetical protein
MKDSKKAARDNGCVDSRKAKGHPRSKQPRACEKKRCEPDEQEAGECNRYCNFRFRNGRWLRRRVDLKGDRHPPQNNQSNGHSHQPNHPLGLELGVADQIIHNRTGRDHSLPPQRSHHFCESELTGRILPFDWGQVVAGSTTATGSTCICR